MLKFSEKIKNKKSQLFKLLTSLMMLSVAVIAFAGMLVTIFKSDIFGWFSFNTNNSVDGIVLNSSGVYDGEIKLFMEEGSFVDYDGRRISIVFDDFFAGSVNSKTLTLVHTNNEDKEIDISWFIDVPRGGRTFETPYIKDGKYYYITSQIAVSDIKVLINDVETLPSTETIPGEGKFLLQTEPLGAGQATYVESEIKDIPPIDLIKSFILPKGKTTTIVFTFTFVDNGEDQSAYQNFDGIAERYLYYEIN